MKPAAFVGPKNFFGSEAQREYPVTLWVQGGTSDIARPVIKSALLNGWRVISAQRSDHSMTHVQRSNFQIAKINGDSEICDSRKISDLLLQKISDTARPVIFLNTIGGAHPNTLNLEQLNKHSTLHFAEAINNFISQRELKPRPSILIHCSSIAAELIPDSEYGRIKKETDDLLLHRNHFNFIDHVFSMRIGYALHSLIDNNTFPHKAHAFGVEQMAYHFPIQPIIVNKNSNADRISLNEGIIYPVHVNDIASAVLNAINFCTTNQKQRLIINATGSQGFTQIELSRLYTNIFNKTAVPFEIPIEDFEKIARGFPLGHIAPYAAEYFRNNRFESDNQEFLRLVGRELTPIKEIAEEIENQKIKTNELNIVNPVFQYAPFVIRRFFRASKEAREALVRVGLDFALESTKQVYRNVIKKLF